MGRRSHRKIKQRKRMVLPHPSKKATPHLLSVRQDAPSPLSIQYEQGIGGNVIGRLTTPWQEIIDSYPRVTHDRQEPYFGIPFRELTCNCKEPHGRLTHNDLHGNNVLFQKTFST
ncbi:Hypothetical protein BRZCDTV_62 [Brazilian cedratvirus IHUMI]|uniref:Uncharacterized protein n=1 Tax=Brazilian cedratvirus IHUMI TaxID=2126980 RepID=A0A2R8FD27_9VIRU|nr:Hypothetical protein BRZCDTV_62 [Brazilian cedratvirus IHUMI]